MSGMIKITNGSLSKPKIIVKNLRIDGEVTSSSFFIKYQIENLKSQNIKHYIYINQNKTEITDNVIYNEEKNEYTYELTRLESSTMYSVQIEILNLDELSKSEIIHVTTKASIIFGVKVDSTNSNTSSSVTYVNDAIGISPANKSDLGGWKDKFPYNQIKLVGFKDGKETKDINPTNRAYYIDGYSVPPNVDVMVKIPKVYWRFFNTSNGYELKISSIKVDDRWDCYAHKVNGVEKDYIYVGAYLGSISNGKLRSTSNVPPKVSTSLTDFRKYAQANGNGYQLWNWFTMMLIQILYIVAYKNLDSQSAIGYGYTETGSTTFTGGTNRRDLCYGSIDGSIQMCFLGIEDLWGNCRQIVDGMKTDNNYNVLVTTDNKSFNDAGASYKNLGKLSSVGTGYISDVTHTNESGFFPSKFGGSTNIYYCDYGKFYINCFATSGAVYSDRTNGGIFSLNIESYFSDTSNGVGTRLCYLG